MAVGGFYIKVQGFPEMIAGFKETAGALKDLSRLNKKIAHYAALDVRLRVPVYMGQHSQASHPRRGGPGRMPTGWLFATIHDSAGPKVARVSAGPAPYYYIQEFGGSAFWHKYGAGVPRSLNRAHYSHAKLISRGAKGHIIYRKARKPRGYFLWNVVWRTRQYIGHTYAEGVAEIARSHGLALEVMPNPDLGIQPQNKP